MHNLSILEQTFLLLATGLLDWEGTNNRDESGNLPETTCDEIISGTK